MLIAWIVAIQTEAAQHVDTTRANIPSSMTSLDTQAVEAWHAAGFARGEGVPFAVRDPDVHANGADGDIK